MALTSQTWVRSNFDSGEIVDEQHWLWIDASQFTWSLAEGERLFCRMMLMCKSSSTIMVTGD